MLHSHMWSDIVVNLKSGLKLLAFVRLRPGDLRVSLPQLLWLALIATAIFLLREKLSAEAGAVFLPWALPEPAWVVLGILIAGALTSLVQAASPLALLTAIAALAPWLIALTWLMQDVILARWPDREQLIGTCLLIVMAVAVTRSIVFTAQRRKIRAVVVGLTLAVALLLSAAWVQLDATLWSQEDAAAADTSNNNAKDIDESLLYDQPESIAQMTDELAPQTPGVTDLYLVGFAGDGAQQIFSREVKFAAAALGEHFDLQGHTALLINNEAEDAAAPLATLEALRRTLQGVATRMDVQEDILFLFLSSHGSPDHELAVEYGGLPLAQITPRDVSEALDEAAIRWRVVVVSACYSGGFVDALRSDTALVITAASADRSSFGCSDENDLTYFGDAFFKQGLAATSDLVAAFGIATQAIEKRERDEHLTPSQPQIFIGNAIRAKLVQLHTGKVVHARLDPSSKRATI
jgi:hypothetical protein